MNRGTSNSEVPEDKVSLIREMIGKVLQGVSPEAALGTPVQPTQPGGLAGFFGLSGAAGEAPQVRDMTNASVLGQDNPKTEVGENAARDWIISKESLGKTTAKNPNSSAFGLGQLIKANREAYGKRLGIDPDTIDRNEQLQLMDAYVKERYGNYQKALEFWKANNWY